MRIRVTDCDVDQISVTPPDSIQDEELDQEVITAALEVLTDRQREISEWILSQSTPVSTTTVSEEFGIQSRTVRAILSNAVKRIEQYGYQAVREEFAPAT
jgi:DNA-directed RNA polymerase sigma subunit (sigma70/sigma32)